MSEWKEVRLGELVSVKGGKRLPKGTQLITAPNTHPYIRIRDITGKKTIELDSSYEYVDEETQKIISRYIVNTGDILVSIVGTIGLVSIVGKSLNLANLTENCVKLVDIRNVDCEYLYYYLVSELGQNEISKGTVGAVQPKLPIKNIESIIVKLPSIPTQRRIAAILSSLDAKIENNNKVNAKLEEIAQNLFKEWFVDFGPFKDGKFVDSELGPIPEGWRVGTLDEITSLISRGVAPKYDDDSDEFILGQTCVRNNFVTLNRARKHKPKVKNEKWVRYGDVLINSTGIGSLGRVGQVYFNRNDVTIDTHLTIVRPSCELYRWYVGRNLLSRQDEIENMAVGSTGQTELPRDSVKSIKLLIPINETIERFNGLIEPVNLQMESLIQENQRLATLRDTLLPKLMSGEIKV